MAATATRHDRTLGSARLREALVGYAFIAVPMGVFLIFFIYPLVYAVYISRYDWGVFGKIEELGWENYRELWHDEIFWRAMKNTAPLHGWSSSLPRWRWGSSLAVIVNAGLRGRAFFRSAFYFPSLASSAAITAIAIYILSADGLLNADHRRPAAVVRRLGHGAVVDRGPQRLDDLGNDDAVLPRRAAGDPDRRLRGGGDRRRQDVADVLEDHLPAAQARPLLRRASSP